MPSVPGRVKQVTDTAYDFHIARPCSADPTSWDYSMGNMKRLTALKVMEERHKQGLVNKCLLVTKRHRLPIPGTASYVTPLPPPYPWLSEELYTRIWKNIDFHIAQKYDAIILDEAHILRHPNSKQCQAVHQLANNITYRIALSGCGFHHPEDIFNWMKFVDPTVFGTDLRQFKLDYDLKDHENTPKALAHAVRDHMFNIG